MGVLGRVLLLLVGCVVATSAWAESGASARLPFAVRWTEGSCHNCRIASRLGSIAFASREDIWAEGYLPPGGMGEGEHTVLHSTDGGHTWRELPNTWQHNVAPNISFANRRDGLLMFRNTSDGDPDLRLTHDGGRSWRRISAPDTYLEQIELLDQGGAAAVSYDIYSKAAALHTASDLEHAWYTAPLPTGFWPDLLRFVDNIHGVVVGCVDHHPAVLATNDWGQHWATTLLDTPSATEAPGPGCEVEISGVTMDAHDQEWLLGQRDSYPLTAAKGFVGIWRSKDSGKSWAPVFRQDAGGSPDEIEFFDGPYALSDGTILVFKDRPDAVRPVMFSTDDGAHWSETPLPRRFGSCVDSVGELVCAGDRFSVAVVRPHLVK